MFNWYYFGDFENTTVGKNIKTTYVYGAGFMELNDTDVTIFDNIDDAMDYILSVPKKSCFLFYNGSRYDFHIIKYWLLTHNYVWGTDKNVRKRFTGIIGDNGTIYQLKVQGKHGVIEFRDPNLLVTGKLSKVGKDFGCVHHKLTGTIDYDKPRGVGYKMTQQEIDYLKADVFVLKEIWEKMLTMGGITEALTAGGYAFRQLQRHLYQDTYKYTDAQMDAKATTKYYKQDLQDCYRAFFPQLPYKLDKKLRKAYRGGYCICWGDSDVYTGHGVVLDFNSLYPYSMCSLVDDHPMPYGIPKYFDDKTYNGGVPNCDCFIVHISTRFILKDGCLPFIQMKNSPFFVRENEYITEVSDCIDLWLTSVDYRLFHDMYTVIEEYVLEGYEFNSYSHFFDTFVAECYKGKANATSKSERTYYKILLNSSYGHTSQRCDRLKGYPELTDDGVATIKLDGEIKQDANGDWYIEYKDGKKLSMDDSRVFPSHTYIPLGAFITAYGRDKTIRSAVKVIDHLRYIDTDSLHLVDITLDEVKQIFNIDGKSLGALDCESEFQRGSWVRQKTYIEENVIESGVTLPEPHITVKACGLTDDGKDMLLEKQNIFNIFTFNLTLDGARLVKHQVEGGVALARVGFKIQEVKPLKNNTGIDIITSSEYNKVRNNSKGG